VAFGVVLRDLLAAASYCAVAQPGPERAELLGWLGDAARRVHQMAEAAGHRHILAPLTRLARAADAAEADPTQVARLAGLIDEAFAAYDPPGL
jgi:glutathione S-transferase